MTGAEVKTAFNEEIDESYTDQWIDSELNVFFKTAVIDVTESLVKEFQNSTVDTNKILPLIDPVTITSFSQNRIDISHTSVVAPNYKQAILIDEMTFTVGSAMKNNVQAAKPINYNLNGGIFPKGTYRYPKYFLSNDFIGFQVGTATCVSLIMWYIKEPIIIDVSNDSTDIPYNLAMINLIKSRAKQIALQSIRDFNFSAIQGQDIIKES